MSKSTWTFYSPLLQRSAFVIAGCGVLMLALVLVTGLPVQLPSPARTLILATIGLTPLLCALTWYLRHQTRVVLSLTGVESTTPSGKRQAFAWHEIASVDSKTKIVTPLNKRVRCVIPFDITRQSKFQNAVIDLAPEGHPMRVHFESKRR